MENFSSRNMLVVLREGYWGTVKSSLQSMKVVLDIPILSYWEIFIGEPLEMLRALMIAPIRSSKMLICDLMCELTCAALVPLPDDLLMARIFNKSACGSMNRLYLTVSLMIQCCIYAKGCIYFLLCH